MPIKVRWPIMAAAVLVLAAASYIGIALVTTGTLGLGALQLPGAAGGSPQRRGYEVISPTEAPQRQPDMVGPVVEVKDKSFIVQPSARAVAKSAGVTLVMPSR